VSYPRRRKKLSRRLSSNLIEERKGLKAQDNQIRMLVKNGKDRKGSRRHGWVNKRRQRVIISQDDWSPIISNSKQPFEIFKDAYFYERPKDEKPTLLL